LINHEYAGFVSSSFIFWSTLFIYQINTRSTLYLLRHFSFSNKSTRGFLQLSIISVVLLILIAHIPFLNFTTILGAGILGLLSILYNLPDKTLSFSVFPLRGIPLLKIFIIAFVWASISSLLPLTFLQKSYLSSDALFIFTAHFLFILGITLPFDLRDYVNDQRQSLLTVPHVIGISNTNLLALLCILGFAIMMSFKIGWVFLMPLVLVCAILIMKAQPDRNEFYFTFWLDGTILLYFLMIYLSFAFST